MKLDRKRFILLFLLLSTMMFLIRCGQVSAIYYTVPDNYEGFLVIRYDCPNGVSPVDPDGRTHITFLDNGTACLRTSYTDVYPSGVSVIAQVQTKQGISVRHITEVDTTTGYGLVDIAVMKNREGSSASVPEDTFSILWVGEVEHLTAMSKDGSYSTRLAEFLATNFGI